MDIKPLASARVSSPFPLRYDEAQGRGEAPPHRPDLEQKYYYGNQGTAPSRSRILEVLDSIPGVCHVISLYHSRQTSSH
jgi:hypothetical protein